MPRQLTDREAFASVLTTLVLERCMASRSTETSRVELQESVPGNERSYVRRGLDALVEHGALTMSGDDIGFTHEGSAFLAYVRSLDGESDEEEHPDAHAAAVPLLTLIAQDARLAPPKRIEDIQTLPGRLDGYRATRQSGLLNRWTLLTAIVVGLGVVVFTQLR
ncbi:hypothetical protein BH11PSE13_BH11PSE13_20370 [soil metagenome]